jgi:hypothetical protein
MPVHIALGSVVISSKVTGVNIYKTWDFYFLFPQLNLGR